MDSGDTGSTAADSGVSSMDTGAGSSMDTGVGSSISGGSNTDQGSATTSGQSSGRGSAGGSSTHDNMATLFPNIASPSSSDSGLVSNFTSNSTTGQQEVATDRSRDSGLVSDMTSNSTTGQQVATDRSRDSGMGSVRSGYQESNVPRIDPLTGQTSVATDTAHRVDSWVTETYEIFLKNLDGKTYTVTVKETDTVATLHTHVEERTRIPVAQQRLLCGTSNLTEPTRTLRDYGVQRHATVHVTGRLRGGQHV